MGNPATLGSQGFRIFSSKEPPQCPEEHANPQPLSRINATISKVERPRRILKMASLPGATVPTLARRCAADRIRMLSSSRTISPFFIPATAAGESSTSLVTMAPPGTSIPWLRASPKSKSLVATPSQPRRTLPCSIKSATTLRAILEGTA
ncbi:MAG: hypothetical protein CMJ96_08900 [Planctomycetes bacterium]|nr:hypothetical protein [Planctomycetota bacterium]